MAVKRIVDTNFWNNSHVIDHYSVEDKYFMLYLLTNPQSTQVGIYSLPKKIISFDTGYTMETVTVLLSRFSQEYGVIAYNGETQEIAILDSLKFSIVKGGKPVSDLIARELKAVNDLDLIHQTYLRLLDFWNQSTRQFDQTIRDLFASELYRRGLTVADEHLETDIELDNESDSNSKSILYFKNNIGYLTPSILKFLKEWNVKLSDEIVEEALKRSQSAANPVKYATQILKSWHKRKVQSLADVEWLDEKYEEQKKIAQPRIHKSTYKEVIPAWLKEMQENGER